jgi:hypothetical protein
MQHAAQCCGIYYVWVWGLCHTPPQAGQRPVILLRRRLLRCLLLCMYRVCCWLQCRQGTR